jgi:hypothetical protein
MGSMTTTQLVERERWRTLRQLEAWLEKPMMALGIAWLVLLLVELTAGLTSTLTEIRCRSCELVERGDGGVFHRAILRAPNAAGSTRVVEPQLGPGFRGCGTRLPRLC